MRLAASCILPLPKPVVAKGVVAAACCSLRLRLQACQTDVTLARTGGQECRLPPPEKAGVLCFSLVLLIWVLLSCLALFDVPI